MRLRKVFCTTKLQNNGGVLTEQTGAVDLFRSWNDLVNQNANQALSAPSFVDVDGDGDLDVVIGSADGRLRYLENTGGGNPPPPPSGTVIESLGDVNLLNTNTGYQIQPKGGSAVSLRSQGNPIGRFTFSGWQAIGAEANTGGGYEMMWRADDGQYGLWLVDATGNATSSRVLTQAEIIDKEWLFFQDFNGDQKLGPVLINTIDIGGKTQLLNTRIGYQIQSMAGGVPVSLRAQGNLVGSSTFGGWQAIGAEASTSGGGYEVMWRAADGQHSLWLLDATGNATSARMITLAEVIAKEALFQQDFNGDQKFGPVVINTIEALGNTDLLNTNAGYQIKPDATGIPVLFRTQGTLVGSDTFSGWQAIGVEATSGGYEAMWRAADGQYGLWLLDAAGNAMSSRMITLAEVIAKEALFQQDFNGDQKLGPVVVNTIEAFGNADLLNTNAGYQIKPDASGVSISLREQGNLVGSSTFSGWQAIGVEATSGGYEAMWRAADGQYGLWRLDATGNATSAKMITLTEVIAKETLFQQDFNGDQKLGPVVINTIEAFGNADLLNTNAGYQIKPDASGVSISLREQGNLVGRDTFSGWQAIGVEATGGGYEAMWRAADGQYGLWLLDAAGNATSARMITLAEVIGKEAFFQQDFNGDGRLGSNAIAPAPNLPTNGSAGRLATQSLYSQGIGSSLDPTNGLNAGLGIGGPVVAGTGLYGGLSSPNNYHGLP